MNTDDHTHLPDEDFVESKAIQHEGRPLVSAALCPECKEIKPLKEFQRYLTPAEAHRRGYHAGAKVLIETTKCRACNPAPRHKLEEHTAAELKRLKEQQAVRTVEANAIISTKQRGALSAQRAAQKERWDKVRRQQWGVVMEGLAKEIDDVRQQMNYAERKGHRRVVLFAEGYTGILKKVLSAMKIDQRNTKRHPPFDRWQEYVSQYDRNIVAVLWNDIEPQQRLAKLRQPQLFHRGFEGEDAVLHIPKPYIPMANKHPTHKDDDNSWIEELTGIPLDQQGPPPAPPSEPDPVDDTPWDQM